ncbi:MAG: UDP-N-acetylenolpyruvoylglucosamine reductase [Candidatus Wildermuthbacteria bacterium RIFCSPHIGHO2_12_FULL_45_9]|nr:MAG: UDP-N-acetylenolpyruvoylglucosamine reductase [Candidatus Wildermuthbacteria bacterium RIFCSPHIGHO2_12_FULL_45_9]
MDIKEILKKEFNDIQFDIPLADHTTFRIGGPAAYFLVCKSSERILKAKKISVELKLPVFILAGGSNLLVSEHGFDGLVLKLEHKDFQISGVSLKAQAGASVSDIVTATTNAGLKGFEWAGGLPGTIGGAIRGNAGAFRGEIKDVVQRVTALVGGEKLETFSREDCRFSYRNSIFKEKGWIVLEAVFQLQQADPGTLQSIAQEHIKYRKERHPLEFPSAGSIFKNCDVKKFSAQLQQELQPSVKQDPFPVVPTAYLIWKACLAGTKIGGAQVSLKHPNYIVNVGGAIAKDVLDLISLIQKNIQKKFGVELEPEIQYVS